MSWKRSLIPIFLFTSTTAQAADAVPPPPPDAEVAPELIQLRGDMAELTAQQVLQNKSHFRPLCDEQGYPLVGNLLPKEPDDSMQGYVAPYQPSQFCAEVRADKPNA